MEDYFDTAPCCYFSFNDSGELLRVNTTLCNALGYKKEELTGRKVDAIFPVATNIFYQTHFFPLLKMHGHTEEIFIFLKAKNSVQLPVLLNAVRVEAEGKLCNECVCIIVHNRKKFEDELVKAKKLAEAALFENTTLKNVTDELTMQTEKLDEQLHLVSKQNHELKQFNRVATHDLQEPLRKVLVFTEMLKALPEGDKKQIIEEKLLRVANQMRETVYGLQQYVWLSEATIHPVKIDLTTLCLGIQQKLAEEFDANLLDLRLSLLPLIKADYYQMHLLFYQLLLNSVQYRKPGEVATVTITTAIFKKNQFRKVKERYKYQDFLKIIIKDNGIGFEPQYKTHVFELFKKLHNIPRRGLGLSICKLIAEKHGGSIDAESIVSEGTEIMILLPGGTILHE